MATNKIVISKYITADRIELLRLLLELQATYFFQNASPQIQELQREKDIKKTYDDYVNFLDEKKDGTWFMEKGCKQVRSDTWEGNELSVKAHQQSGFFISGISFGKKL